MECILAFVLLLVVVLVILLAAMYGTISKLRREVNSMETVLNGLARWIVNEPRPSKDTPPCPAEPAPPTPPSPPGAPVAAPVVVAPVVDRTASRAAPPEGETEILLPLPPRPEPAAETPVVTKPGLELFVGRKLMAWVGMLALLVASVLFLSYAYQRHWLRPEMKVSLYVAVGVALLALGEWASRKGWAPLARTLTGGGIAELLFANYSAMVLYELIGWPLFLAFTALVIAVAILLALRYDSVTISIIATLSGMIVPILLWDMSPNFGLIFLFLAAVDISVVVLTAAKRWPVIHLIAFLGTGLNVMAWLVDKYDLWRLLTWHREIPADQSPGLALAVLVGFFALFLVASIVYHLVRRIRCVADWPGFAINPLWTLLAVYALFNELHYDAITWATLGLAALYGILAAAMKRRLSQPEPMYSLSILLSVGLLALAVARQFDGLMIPTLLAVLAAGLYVVSEWLGEWRLRTVGYAVLMLTVAFLLALSADLLPRGERPILNLRVAALGTLAAALAVVAVVIRRSRVTGPYVAGPSYTAVPVLLAHTTVLMLFTLETANYFAQHDDATTGRLARQMVYSIGYALYAAAMLGAGFAVRQVYLRAAGLALFAATLGKIFLYDLSHLSDLYRIASVLVLALLLLGGAYLYSRFQHLLLPKEHPPQ
jgi:uncharacterized membrane protein